MYGWFESRHRKDFAADIWLRQMMIGRLSPTANMVGLPLITLLFLLVGAQAIASATGHSFFFIVWQPIFTQPAPTFVASNNTPIVDSPIAKPKPKTVPAPYVRPEKSNWRKQWDKEHGYGTDQQNKDQADKEESKETIASNGQPPATPSGVTSPELPSKSYGMKVAESPKDDERQILTQRGNNRRYWALVQQAQSREVDGVITEGFRQVITGDYVYFPLERLYGF